MDPDTKKKTDRLLGLSFFLYLYKTNLFYKN